MVVVLTTVRWPSRAHGAGAVARARPASARGPRRAAEQRAARVRFDIFHCCATRYAIPKSIGFTWVNGCSFPDDRECYNWTDLSVCTSSPAQFQTTLPIGEYAAVALLAFFGFKSVKDAWALPDNANGNLQGNSEPGELAEAEELVKEKVSKKLTSPLEVLWKSFSLVFFAEWGDRSMLATIALGAAQCARFPRQLFRTPSQLQQITRSSESQISKMSTSSESNDSNDSDGSSVEVKRQKLILQAAATVALIGMHHAETYLQKRKRFTPRQSGNQWVMDQLRVTKDCYRMFRMTPAVFYKLHDTLVESYGLKSTRHCHSIEALGMFLWMCGGPQSFSQVENRFKRSTETISKKFREVLKCVNELAKHNINPKESQSTVHPKLQDSRFSPYFNNCIGAIDGTHIPVVVPAKDQIAHIGRHGYPTQNVMVICDFDMRFTFVVAGWPGSAHDSRIFNDTLSRYSEYFPHPEDGKFYLVDAGYPNRKGYLAPYKGQKYHLPEFQRGGRPSGQKEVFNHAHSSLRNVIERVFGVLKMKWRILLHMPSYKVERQKQIIIACMALHNFIRDSALSDHLFERCDDDEEYMPHVNSSTGGGYSGTAQDDGDMCAFRDSIANGLMASRI